MLFEREPLTPKGKANVLTGIFAEVAGRSASDKSAQGVVPREVLEAYGDLCKIDEELFFFGRNAGGTEIYLILPQTEQ